MNNKTDSTVYIIKRVDDMGKTWYRSTPEIGWHVNKGFALSFNSKDIAAQNASAIPPYWFENASISVVGIDEKELQEARSCPIVRQRTL